jgi:hypothetical protein
MDQLCSFKATSGEKKHILMCLDYIIKHVEPASVTDTTSALVVKFINENIHFRHGGSTRIMSDHGTAFSSHLMEEKTKDWGTHHVLDEIFIIRNHLEVHIISSLSELTRKWIYLYDY